MVFRQILKPKTSPFGPTNSKIFLNNSFHILSVVYKMENYDPGNMFSSPLDLVASNTFIRYGNLGKPSILGFAYGQRCA